MQPGPSSPPEPIRLSDGQSIEEVQRSRWWKVAIGLVAIVAFAALLKLVLSRRHASPPGD
jgi:hypothetical protein